MSNKLQSSSSNFSFTLLGNNLSCQAIGSILESVLIVLIRDELKLTTSTTYG